MFRRFMGIGIGLLVVTACGAQRGQEPASATSNTQVDASSTTQGSDACTTCSSDTECVVVENPAGDPCCGPISYMATHRGCEGLAAHSMNASVEADACRNHPCPAVIVHRPAGAACVQNTCQLRQ